MAAKSPLRLIFEDIVGALSPIVGSKYVFLKDRPNVKEGSAPMPRFCVIDLPIGLRDYVAGSRKTLLETVGVMYLFTQARSNNTLDVNATGDFAEEVEALFPINGTYCTATTPVLQLRGADEFGYQVATLTFNLRGRWGVFERYKQSLTT